MMMQTGEGADYAATFDGVEINIADKYSTRHTFHGWKLRESSAPCTNRSAEGSPMSRYRKIKHSRSSD